MNPRSLSGIATILTVVIIAIWTIADFYSWSIDQPYRGMMNDNKTLVGLLEQGRTIEGKILKRWYQEGRPPGWEIFYSFEVPNPKDGKLEIYYGSACGPKNYYGSLSKGDTITIIYYPAEPKINSEIYEFLNDPNYRWVFKQTGKLELFNKFRDKYKDKFENYADITWWYNQSRRK
jgi:hypothetical protein